MHPSKKYFSKHCNRHLFVRRLYAFCITMGALICAPIEICPSSFASSLGMTVIRGDANAALRIQSNSRILQTFTDQNITTPPSNSRTRPQLMQLMPITQSPPTQTPPIAAIGDDDDETHEYVNPNLDDAPTTDFSLGGFTPPPGVGVSPSTARIKYDQQQTLPPDYKFPERNDNNHHLQTNDKNAATTGQPDPGALDANPMDADKPDTRLKLAEYIFIQFHEHNVGSLLDANERQLATNFRTLLGPNPPPAEPLIELAGNSSIRGALNDSSTFADYSGGAYHGGTLASATTAANSTATNATHTVRPFYGDTFHAFTVNYWLINCTTCLVICTVGIFANLMNMVVLTRPNMISPVNTILCAIACSDFIVNLSNIPYLTHELSDNSNISAYYSYGWAFYILMHAHVTVTAHTLSIWLTCALAIWRYAVLTDPPSSSHKSRCCLRLGSGAQFTVNKALQAIVCLVISVPIICIPNYLSFAIVEDKADNGTTIYKVGFSGLAESSHHIRIFHFWIFSCLTKLIPCCLLAFFTTLLIKKLLVARDRRLRLTAGSNQNRCSSACATLAAGGATQIEQTRKASAPNGQLLFRRNSSKKKAAARAQHHPELSDKKLAANGISQGSNKAPNGDTSSCGANNNNNNNNNNDPNILVQVTNCHEGVSSGATGGGGGGGGISAPAVSRLVQQVAIGAPHELMHDEDDEFRCGAGSTDLGHHYSESVPPATASCQQRPVVAGGGNVASGGPAAHTRHSSGGGVCRIHGVRHQLSATPLSNSSCTTDAECLPGSNTSSGSDNMSLSETLELGGGGGQQHCHHQHLQRHDQRVPVAQQQLLVETRQDASSPSGQIVSTRTHAGGPPAIQTRLADANELKRPSNATGGTGRSASTCGALDLYAINLDSNRDGAMCVTAAASSTTTNKPGQERDEHLDNSATSLIKQNGRPLSFKLNRNSERAISTTPLVGGNRAGHNTSLDKTGQDAGASRGRSVGSATIAPLQIVKFQATHRQLSQNETTTRLLIAVIIVFLICESPAGILAALCAVFGQEFFENVYQPMGIVTDLLALINSAVNFVLYCFMSTQFRVTFYQVVLRCPAPIPPKGQQLTHKQRVAANRR